METKLSHFLRALKPNCATVAVLCGVFALLLLDAERHRCAAAEFREGFDGRRTSWRVRTDKSQVRLLSHRRHQHVYLRGGGSENLEFVVSGKGATVQLEHELPPSRTIDDLSLSLWVRSNHGGAKLAVRVIFPHQTDPRTGTVLHTFLRGDVYTKAGKWQQLEFKSLEKKFRTQLGLLRYQLNDPQIDARDSYVDRVVLLASLRPGTTEFYLDELRFGPIIRPANAPPIVHTDDDADDGPPVEFRLDRLLVEGHPFFPRMAPYHGEELEVLEQAGFNVAWIPDLTNERLMVDLRRHGIWSAATPPRPVSSSGIVLSAHDASLMPFTRETKPILFWYAGTRIPAREREKLVAWSKQIRSADRKYNRPLMADVTGDERVFSRHLSMMGTSRHVINTSLSLKRYRDWLYQKRKLARPGSFVWTWIQTEAVSANANLRRAGHKIPIVVEYEQIRLQVYAALSAGCRGIGYWKTDSLQGDAPGQKERRLAITLLNLELELLEPWLATGRLVGHVPFTIERAQSRRIGQRRLDFRNSQRGRAQREALLRARKDRLRRDQQIDGELEAAIIRSDYGLLILPVWYEQNAQFVPGQMVGENASIVVEEPNESALAWEITTTGIRSLPRERVAGGLRITLKKFDQTAAVILSSDPKLKDQLQRKMRSMAEKSARVSIDLAVAKRDRVADVDLQLRNLGAKQPDAPQLLSQASRLIDLAEIEQQRGNYDAARRHSADAMQSLRILQRAHWNDAVRPLTSPVSSPHTVCFQTLPDHWRMIKAIGRSRLKDDVNLLRSGDFEDIDTMLAEGWRHQQNRMKGIRADVDLYSDSRHGKYCLRLWAVPETGAELPAVVSRPPVKVTTPPMTVRAGQIVHISGWVRAASPTVGSLDGAMIYDSLHGAAGGLRWHEAGGWQRFQMIREINQSGPFTLTFVLNGLGELQLDELRVVPHNPRPESSPSEKPPEPDAPPNPRPSALQFLNHLPKLNPLAPRE